MEKYLICNKKEDYICLCAFARLAKPETTTPPTKNERENQRFNQIRFERIIDKHTVLIDWIATC